MSLPPPPTPEQEQALHQALEAFGGDAALLASAASALAQERAATASARRSKPAPDTPVIVSLEHTSRTYKLGKTTVQAVQDVSLEVHEREFVAITGSSGSGKSTMLNLIGGLDRPDNGTVTVAGRDLAKLRDGALAEYRNQTVGFVFQFFYLQPFLTLRQNLEVPAMFGRMPRGERDERTTELAEAVGVADRLDHLPRELSGGQMQRAAIARALVNRPKVLLADEPTGNLDSTNSRGIMELFTQVRERYGTTVIVITHDQHVAGVADRTITMTDGRIA